MRTSDPNSLELYRKTIETYGSQAAVQKYIQTLHAHRDASLHSFLSHIKEVLPEGSRILDVGSGTGLDVQYLREAGFLAYGIDISQHMIEHAVKLVGPYFKQTDVRVLNQCQCDAFDAIISVALFQHLARTDAPTILHGMQHLLKSGGLLCIITKAGEGFYWDTRLGASFPRAVTLYTEAEFYSLLLKSGFSNVSVSTNRVRRARKVEKWIFASAIAI